MEASGIINASLVCSDVFQLPYKGSTFDSLISLNFIHLFASDDVNQQKKIVLELERIVKKGGSVVIEFDNVMYAKELGNHYRDLFKISGTMKIETIIGMEMPKTKAIMNISRTIALLYTSLAAYSPFKYFARYWVVKFVKK